MKNVLNYYYNLNPTSIHQVNKNYRCYIDDDEYLLVSCDRDSEVINEIFELSKYLLENQIPCHQIILNKSGEIITIINALPYILLKIFIKNRMTSIDDLIFFSNFNFNDNEFKRLNKSNWQDLWVRKIDYFEYQVSQLGKRFPIVKESFNYYVGLAENGISLFNNLLPKEDYNLIISHKRVKLNDGIMELLNPLNFILDNKVRDLSEFIKEQFFYGNYSFERAKVDIYKFQLVDEQYIMLFSRLLFPTYYFDCYEDVIHGNVSEKELIKIINKNSEYLKFLRNVYNYLRQFTNMPEIEWLIKNVGL